MQPTEKYNKAKLQQKNAVDSKVRYGCGINDCWKGCMTL